MASETIAAGLPAWSLRFEFKLEDLWIGAFWKTARDGDGVYAFDLWVCFLPCVPLHLSWRRRTER